MSSDELMRCVLAYKTFRIFLKNIHHFDEHVRQKEIDYYNNILVERFLDMNEEDQFTYLSHDWDMPIYP